MDNAYYAVLVSQHVGEIPHGLEEPHGIFGSEEEARDYLRDMRLEWNAAIGGWPFEARIQSYATRQQAEAADVADGILESANHPLRIMVA